ncbi:MAG: LPS-assembly protein LptD [Epsilonproteobacteria bacterium]|nr:LPS-assembly protein LptD [Campylobacterota bacterium]
MLKFLTLISIFGTLLLATDKIAIYATNILSKDSRVEASGEVVVVYKDYYLSSNRAIYDKKTGILELFEDIRINQDKNYKLLGNYAKVNISKKERSFKPFFMLEKKSKVWISADEGCASDNNFSIQSGMISGCNPNNPLWKMHFSSSTYNSDTKWLNIYNARIYIYDILLFYTPYFGYSLDTTRRTGLLTPSVGTSSQEGFYYEQPIYIAEQNWWDLELKPQIRTNRGYGGYSKFRFVDSTISKGEFTTGYFKEYNKYFLLHNLANDKHYGYNFLYSNNDVINQWLHTKLEGQSGIYMDLNSMNDVDYINLSTNDTTTNITSKQVLSRINIFYNGENNYFGVYFKYYKDLTKDNNEDTIQKLPTFQYHRYMDTILKNHIIYNMDIQSTNIYRYAGKRAIQTDLNIPITLQKSFFDEYLNTSYKAYIYGQYSKFDGEEEIPTDEYKNGYFARYYHILSASTDLTRAFDEVTHTMSFGATYTVGGSESKNGYYQDNENFCEDKNNQNTPQCEFYNVSDIEEKLELSFTQYFYNISGKQIFYHKLAQNISYGNTKNKIGELENELDIQINNYINVYNNMFYNFDEHKFSKIYNRLTFKNNNLEIYLSHLYKNSFLQQSDTYSPLTSYITSSASYTYDSHYSYSMRFDYDLETSLRKSIEVGFLYKKRCWDFGLKYLENNRPVLTENGSTSIYDRYLYFTVTLKPIMESGSGSLFDWKLPSAF